MKRRCPGRGRTANSSRFLHGGEFSFGGSQLVRVQVGSFGKNWRAWLGEKMVADGMTRQRGCETVGGQNVRKLKEHVGDTLGSGEKRCWERRR